MKQWNMPEFLELDLSETSHDIGGQWPDGGTLNDNVLTGHGTNDPSQVVDPCSPCPKPTATPFS